MPTLIARNTSVLEQCDSTVFTQDGPLFFGFMWPSMFIGNEIVYFNCQQNQKLNEAIQAVSADGKIDEFLLVTASGLNRSRWSPVLHDIKRRMICRHICRHKLECHFSFERWVNYLPLYPSKRKSSAVSHALYQHTYPRMEVWTWNKERYTMYVQILVTTR